MNYVVRDGDKYRDKRRKEHFSRLFARGARQSECVRVCESAQVDYKSAGFRINVDARAYRENGVVSRE